MIRIIFILLYFHSVAFAQVIYPYRTTTSPKELKEFSGIAKVKENVLAGINDGGNESVIYLMDTLGKLISTIPVVNQKNTDWEELFYADGKLYIADVGDNLCQRKQTRIIEFDVNEKKVLSEIPVVFTEKQNLPLPDSQLDFDCEAGFIDNGTIHLFTKTHSSPYSGKSYQYSFSNKNTSTPFHWKDSTSFGKRGFINSSLTGAAISPDQKLVAFISCTHLWIKYKPENEKYFDAVTLDFDFDGLTQKEAVTFINNHRFVVADERFRGTSGGRMYYFNIQQFLTGKLKYFKPFIKSAFLSSTSKPGTLELEVELTKKIDSITVVIVDKNANWLHQQKIKVPKNNFESKIIMNMGKLKPRDLYGFWLIENDQVIYTSKIGSTW